MKMEKILVVGGGGHAKVIVSLLKKINRYCIAGYVDKADHGDILGVVFLGQDDVLDELYENQNIKKAVLGVGSVGDNSIRIRLQKKVSSIGFAFPDIISPAAIINEGTSVGNGTVIMDGVVINSGAKIGDFAIVNTNASIDHDTEIGNFVHIAPGATVSGGVKIGNNSFIGAGATIIQYMNIADNCTIGAGALVIGHCSRPGKYIGSPARLMK